MPTYQTDFRRLPLLTTIFPRILPIPSPARISYHLEMTFMEQSPHAGHIAKDFI